MERKVLTYEELVKTDHGLSKEAMAYLLKVDILVEFLLNNKKSTHKILDSLTDEVGTVGDMVLDMQKNIEAKVMGKMVNPSHPVESSPSSDANFSSSTHYKQLNLEQRHETDEDL